MADLPAPVRVSPLIKFGRWSFLIAGILYGASHNRSLAKKEAVIREIEDKKRAAKEEKLREEKLRLAKESEPFFPTIPSTPDYGKELREIEEIKESKPFSPTIPFTPDYVEELRQIEEIKEELAYLAKQAGVPPEP